MPRLKSYHTNMTKTNTIWTIRNYAATVIQKTRLK